MTRASIDLIYMPYDMMLLIEYPSGVVYRHQVGGNYCWQAELEGVLAPVDFSDAEVQQVMTLTNGVCRISAEVADAIDAILAANPRARYLSVDRTRLHESFEAWVYVRADTQDDAPDHLVNQDYLGSVYDFGTAKGLLIWPNSD